MRLGNASVNILLDFFELLFICCAVFVVVYLFVGQLLEVNGDSMLPNFTDKEQIIAEKVSIKLKDPERGEIIIFRHPQQPDKLLIKRLIGLPGEIIKIESGNIYINGNKLSENYLQKDATTEGKEVIKENTEYKIDESAYVFMGDNRSQSTDSRDWGAVSKDLVVGRAVFVYYPIEKVRIIK